METGSIPSETAVSTPAEPAGQAPLLAGFATEAGDARWAYLNRALLELGSGELQQRQQLIRRLLRDNGVAHSGLGANASRPWLLDPMPLAISSAAWRTVEQGLLQRAELWRRLLDDLYGEQLLLQRGVLPAELVFGDPGFLRPCVGMLPPLEHQRLPLYAADLAQAPDGTIQVVGERAQSLSGIGYALENRIVLSRVLPSLFRDAGTHRLAQFFRTLRQTLQSLAGNPDQAASIVLLTPGTSDRHYFEHAYLANYLGYPLVQSGDLRVRDCRVHLRALDGLRPVDVLLRWLPDSDCDPLELRQDSPFGLAGLLQAVRARQAVVVNPIGSSLLENPGLAAYLPRLCRELLGEDLRLTMPVTHWCGDGDRLAHVLARLNRLVIHDLAAPGRHRNGSRLDRTQRDALSRYIRAQPWRFVAREPFPPTTVQVLQNGALQVRPVILRSFVVAAGEDYLVMPGGLGWIAGDAESPRGAEGGIGKDVWVLASEPTRPLSLLSGSDRLHAAAGSAELSSRVAENLFWLGRYAERSENLIRLLRVILLELLELEVDETINHQGCLPGLLRALTGLTETYPGFIGEGASERLRAPDEELTGLLLDPRRSGGLAFTLNALLNAAQAVRDRISPDIWRVLTEVDEGLQQLHLPAAAEPFRMSADTDYLNQALEQLNQLLTACAAFSGLALDSMTHGQGWRFLMIGRRLERSLQIERLLHLTLVDNPSEAALLEPLLHICDSVMTYRGRYRSGLQLEPVLELLLLDETNPRSLGYQLRHLQHDVGLLPGQGGSQPYRRREPRLVLAALSALRLTDSATLAAGKDRPALDQLLQGLDQQLSELGEALAGGYFRHSDPPRQLVSYRGEG